MPFEIKTRDGRRLLRRVSPGGFQYSVAVMPRFKGRII
jgi:hypothetical protein